MNNTVVTFVCDLFHERFIADYEVFMSGSHCCSIEKANHPVVSIAGDANDDEDDMFRNSKKGYAYTSIDSPCNIGRCD